MTRKHGLPILALLAAALLYLLLRPGGQDGLELADPEAPGTFGTGEPGFEPGPTVREPAGTGAAEPEPDAPPPVVVGSEPDDGSGGGAAGASSVPAVPRTGSALRVRAFDRVSNEPLDRFRYIWIQDGSRRTGSGEDGLAELEITPDRNGRIVVEAEGYEPDSRSQVSVRTGAGSTELVFHLAPMASQAGVELTVLDDRAVPVPHVRVDVWRVREASDPEELMRTAPLWSRRASEDDGVYRLPGLEPGTYRLRVRALEEGGADRPLLPASFAVDFLGNQHVPLFAGLEPGALLQLEVYEQDGSFAAAGTGIRVTFPEDGVRNVTWIVESEGRKTGALGALPAVGAASPAEALPPGRFKLEFFRAGEPVHTAWIALAPGERHTERVVLPSPR